MPSLEACRVSTSAYIHQTPQLRHLHLLNPGMPTTRDSTPYKCPTTPSTELRMRQPATPGHVVIPLGTSNSCRHCSTSPTDSFGTPSSGRIVVILPWSYLSWSGRIVVILPWLYPSWSTSPRLLPWWSSSPSLCLSLVVVFVCHGDCRVVLPVVVVIVVVLPLVMTLVVILSVVMVVLVLVVALPLPWGPWSWSSRSSSL